MVQLKKIGTYLVTLLFLLYSVFMILPNLNFSFSGLELVTKTLKSIATKSYKYNTNKVLNRGSVGGWKYEKRQNTGYTIIYTMTDNSTHRITGHNPKYNRELLSKDNVGKTIKIYTEKEGSIPVQLEIDNKVIFGLKETNQLSYFILAATLAFVIYSILLWKKKVEF